jgi:hypothetical protein
MCSSDEPFHHQPCTRLLLPLKQAGLSRLLPELTETIGFKWKFGFRIINIKYALIGE